MQIYPAIDIRGGRCVRLVQGKADAETVYFENPVDAADLWNAAGTAWIHVVDLDGAFTGQPKNWPAVEKIAATGAKIQLGGGLRDEETVEHALSRGVSRVVIGTRACADPEFVRKLVGRFGGSIAVGIDAKDGQVAVKGWVDTMPQSPLDLAAEMVSIGVETIVYTDISMDGMLAGPNLQAQEAMLRIVPARIIASGGVGSRADVEALLKLGANHDNLEGVIIGKALYDRKVDLADLIQLTRESGA